MNNYRLKNYAVKAVRYLGQPLEQLPEFVRNYSAFSAMSGQSKLGRNLVGNILVPHHGGYYTCVPGEWLILSDGKLTVLTDKGFNNLYESTDDAVAPAPVVEAPAPVAAPAPEPTPVPVVSPTVVPVIETAPAPVIEPAPTAADVPAVEPVTTGTPPADLTQNTSDASQQ